MSLDELEAAGMTRMTDDEIRAFLSTQNTGVLGVPGDEAPYMIPLSFGFDEDATLYFTFVLGSSSRKETLSDRATVGRFLAFDAPSLFTWQSVLLTGRIDRVPDDERAAAAATLEDAWRPDLFESAESTRGVEIYRFRIDEQNGIKHTGLPPALRGNGETGQLRGNGETDRKTESGAASDPES